MIYVWNQINLLLLVVFLLQILFCGDLKAFKNEVEPEKLALKHKSSIINGTDHIYIYLYIIISFII